MKEINLNLKDEVILIELTQKDYGQDALVVHLYEGDTPVELTKANRLVIDIQREETLVTTMVANYDADHNAFWYMVKKALVETVGEKPARVSIVDMVEEITKSYPAKWIIKES